MESGSRVMYRYKYLPMNELSLKIVTEGTLKFSCATEFNDLFDSRPAYDRDSIDLLPKKRPDLMRKVRKDQNLTYTEYFRIKPSFTKKLHNTVDSGDWTRSILCSVGIFCVSRDPCSSLMWSHYADHHRGFVVELRLSIDAPEPELHRVIPIAVDYVSERPVLKLSERDSKIEPYFLTKDMCWEYEQEERVLDTDRGPGIYRYSRENFLHSVIAGARMSDRKFEELRKIVDQASDALGKEVQLHRAKTAQKEYRIYIPKHPNPELSRP